MDPLSITTGIIALYSTLLQLREFAAIYAEAPQVISYIQRDCSTTLNIIRRARSKLDQLDALLTDDDKTDHESIRRDLLGNIEELLRKLFSLQSTLKDLLRSPDTNFDQLRNLVTTRAKINVLRGLHRDIVERREVFERLQRSLDSDNILRILQRQSGTPTSPVSPNLPIAATNSGQGKRGSVTSIDSTVSSQIATLGPEVLLDAIRSGEARDVAIVLKYGEIDPNFRSGEEGMYPLHIAAAQGDVQSITHLLDFKAIIGVQDNRGKTPLHIAARGDRADAIQFLVHMGADPNAHDSAGATALWCAAGHGTSPNAITALTFLGADVINHYCNKPLMPTALWAAAAKGHIDTAITLLQAGADPNIADSRGSTILHQVEWPAAAKLTPLLLKCGANAMARDHKGMLPLHRAAEAGRTCIATWLLRHTAVNSRASDGSTALIHAAERGKLKLCRFLAEQGGADWRLSDSGGNDAFYVACASGHVLCAAYLLGLARGARDISAGNAVGNTALHAAARCGHLEVVKWLLNQGADKAALSTRDSPRPGITPAQAARKAANESVRRSSTSAEAESKRARLEGIAKLIEGFVLDDDPVDWEVEAITLSSEELPVLKDEQEH